MARFDEGKSDGHGDDGPGRVREDADLLHAPDLSEVFRLTVRTRLTAYDAAYLLLRSRSAELVTLDEKLARVWSRLQG